MDDREELIRRRAYAIWESEGRPTGEDKRHWEQARREMDEDEERSSKEETEEDTATIVAPSTAPHGKAHLNPEES